MGSAYTEEKEVLFILLHPPLGQCEDLGRRPSASPEDAASYSWVPQRRTETCLFAGQAPKFIML